MDDNTVREVVYFLYEDKSMNSFIRSKPTFQIKELREFISKLLLAKGYAAIPPDNRDMSKIVYTYLDGLSDGLKKKFSEGALARVKNHSVNTVTPPASPLSEPPPWEHGNPCSEILLTNNKETTMETFTTTHSIFGKDISKMTDSEVFTAIATIEQQIKSLKKIKTKSVKKDDTIAKLKADIVQIVELLDGRE